MTKMLKLTLLKEMVKMLKVIIKEMEHKEVRIIKMGGPR